MPRFSKRSFTRLKTCDLRLVALFGEVVKHFDCTVLEGQRDKKTQEHYFETGKTKLHWPNSKHNVSEDKKSLAVDVIPYPVDWRFENNLWEIVMGRNSTPYSSEYMLTVHNIERWFKFGGYVLGIAQQMGIPLIWGGDWDGDNQMSDQRFDDLPHFELGD